MNNKRAFVVNGNKNYRHRVFAIKGGSIVKSWDTDVYLPLSKVEIDRQLGVRNEKHRATCW